MKTKSPHPKRAQAKRAKALWANRKLPTGQNHCTLTARQEWLDQVPVLVLPLSTAKQARAAARFWNLGEEERVAEMARAASCLPHGPHMSDSWWKAYVRDYPGAWESAQTTARAILNLIAPK